MNEAEQLVAAVIEEHRLRYIVESWMAEQGRLGKLTQNRYAPMWPEYEKALNHRNLLMASIGAKALRENNAGRKS